MYGYIYLTTNLINGKRYIGQHRAEVFEPDKYMGSGKLILEAFNKYGKQNFKCELLEECFSDDELNSAEIKWIAYYNAYEDKNFYNITRGGEGHVADPWNKGKHGVQEWTLAMEAAFEYGRHLPASDKLKQTLSEIRTGIEVSQETRDKLSDVQRGKIMVNNGVKNIFIKAEDYELYLVQGWEKGKIEKDCSTRVEKYKATHYSDDENNINKLNAWKYNLSKAITGKRWVTNGVEDKQINPENIEYYINIGWRLGRSKARGNIK